MYWFEYIYIAELKRLVNMTSSLCWLVSSEQPINLCIQSAWVWQCILGATCTDGVWKIIELIYVDE